jgi:two-component sensor histidine kinase
MLRRGSDARLIWINAGCASVAVALVSKKFDRDQMCRAIGKIPAGGGAFCHRLFHSRVLAGYLFTFRGHADQAIHQAEQVSVTTRRWGMIRFAPWALAMQWLIRFVPVYKRPIWRGQLIALITVLAAIAGRSLADPLINGGLIFTFLFPGILVAGLFGGAWSGISTAFLGGLLMAFIWIPPSFGLMLTTDGIFRLLTFWPLAGLMIFLTSFVQVILKRLATAEARAKTIASEMKHRVENNLALVQSIARQTFRTSNILSETEKLGLFTDRLAALARAQDLIENFEQKDLSAERLVRRALAPFEMQQFILAGSPSTVIPDDHALSLVLLIHELATNAAKYGALSTLIGRVEISWNEDPKARVVSFNWKERFGPPVVQPSRAGFGSRLLKAAFAFDGANATIVYEPDGVRCAVSFAIASPANDRTAVIGDPLGQVAAPAA